MIERRAFLKGGLAAAAAAVVPARPAGRFDYAALKAAARNLAAAPFQALPESLPPSLANLSWDTWEAIRFRDEFSLWRGQGLPFEVRYFHLGLAVRRPVRLYAVEDGMAHEIAFDPRLFDYGHSGLDPATIPRTLGFAGLRILFHTDLTRDIAAFQNHSYFRAVDGTRQYGLSHRGLAIDCGMSTPEEFPYFVAYYLERPEKRSNRLTLYGLMDSRSVSGAYRFVIDVADTLLMDIDAALYPRARIERLGIAPGTSMFLCGANDRRVPPDVRPQIHDSDGLQMLTGAGEWLWRPLVNPETTRVNSYVDENPRGFGLMQRDHDFDHYQDDGAYYDRRPCAWVEPRGHWGKGSVVLVELPELYETADNIVAFWNPAEKPQPGAELLYGYRLLWCRENPLRPTLATAVATRTGIGGVIGRVRTYFAWRFEVDFAGDALSKLGAGAHVIPEISASRGQIELPSARPLESIHGWRVIFDLKPADDSVEPINLRLLLKRDGKPLTETWIYQYTPPPPPERQQYFSKA
ncbi:MAG TPA: glucan biosynthesis protein D [Steroidobacteraceae bacterium]|nr:glucan biosynthesis protein D [Steroidobacteraceae bacterium]